MGLSINALTTKVANTSKPGDGAALEWLRAKGNSYQDEANELEHLGAALHGILGPRLHELSDAYSDLVTGEWINLETFSSNSGGRYELFCQGRVVTTESGPQLQLAFPHVKQGLTPKGWASSGGQAHFSAHAFRAAQRYLAGLTSDPEFDELPGLAIAVTSGEEFQSKSKHILNILVSLPLGKKAK